MVGKPVVLHVPHSSLYIPDADRARILLNDEELREALFDMTDWFTDELFPVKKFDSVVSQVSRLIVDVERFRDDSLEPMAKKGQGAVYVATGQGLVLRDHDEAYREQLLRTYYDTHHSAFNLAVARCLQSYERCLIIDCHSYSAALVTDRPNEAKPEICIGADALHTPEHLVRAAVDCINDSGFSVAVNTPFAGAIVPQQFHAKNSQVCSIMLEVERSLYMMQTHKSGEVAGVGSMCAKKSAFATVASFLESLIDHIADVWKPV